MNKGLLNLLLIVVVVLGFIGFNSLYVVNEGSKGIVTRFGKVLRNSDGKLNIVDPGLHIKAPFIDHVKDLDVRIQTISSSADRFVTSEKKDVIIDSYVKWQILDAATYYLTTAGLYVTDTALMTPRKSVTALLGVSRRPVTGHLAGCGHCALRDRCEYRKRGKTCASQ